MKAKFFPTHLPKVKNVNLKKRIESGREAEVQVHARRVRISKRELKDDSEGNVIGTSFTYESQKEN